MGNIYLFVSGLKVSKCSKYWPNAKAENTFGNFLIKNTSGESVSRVYGLTKRCLEIKIGNGGPIKQVVQYHYTNWPDFGVPDSPQPLVEMVNVLREELTTKGGVGLIHCSAGVGRTGQRERKRWQPRFQEERVCSIAHHSPMHTTHDFVDVINLHQRGSLEVR